MTRRVPSEPNTRASTCSRRLKKHDVDLVLVPGRQGGRGATKKLCGHSSRSSSGRRSHTQKPLFPHRSPHSQHNTGSSNRLLRVCDVINNINRSDRKEPDGGRRARSHEFT